MGLENNDDIVDMFGTNKSVSKRPKSNVIDVEVIKPQNRQKRSFDNIENVNVNANRGQSRDFDDIKFSTLMGNSSNNSTVTTNTATTNTTKSDGLDNIKITGESAQGLENSLKNVPPLLLVGIVAIIGASFTPYKWLFTVGFLLIILAMFGKILTPDKKAIMKEKLKNLFKKKNKGEKNV